MITIVGTRLLPWHVFSAGVFHYVLIGNGISPGFYMLWLFVLNLADDCWNTSFILPVFFVFFYNFKLNIVFIDL